jgi:hypothetical protein
MKQCQLFQKPMLLLSFLLISSLCFSQVIEQWVKRYDAPLNYDDLAADVAVDALGNTYVTGHSADIETNFDYATIKYNAVGNELWVKRYNSPGRTDDFATNIATDARGNVYVTGYYTGGGTGGGYTTIKYDTDGNQQWVRIYEGPSLLDDVTTDLVVDVAGNVYVTGGSWDNDSGDEYDYATIKYDTDGNEMWVRRYNEIGSVRSFANSLAVDAHGNVYVTGYSAGNETAYDYATLKYDAAGNELWAKRYNGTGNYNDFAQSLAVDASGNVYVTGSSDGDYVTLKYDAAGNELWLKRYGGFDYYDDHATMVAVDANGNVYVTGWSERNRYLEDYVTVKYDAAGKELWVRKYKGAQMHNLPTTSLVLDASGNVYIAGSSSGSVSNDYATIKYDTNGNEQWAQTYNGVGNHYDVARAIAVDGSGNVYVTGESYGSETACDYATIKYSQTQITQTISSFTLINSDSNKDIQELKQGDIIDPAALVSPRLTMRANTSPSIVGSVLFRLKGPFSRKHIESTAPYVLFANRKGNYYGRAFPAGNYTLTATPYSDAKGAGTKGTPLVVHFTVASTVVNSLTRIAATNLQENKILKNGIGVKLEALPNPFASQTTIRFSVPTSGYTNVQVYDGKGRVVECLYQAWAERGKTYQVPFKSKQLQSGIYMLQVATGKQVQSSKLVLIR